MKRFAFCVFHRFKKQTCSCYCYVLSLRILNFLGMFTIFTLKRILVLVIPLSLIIFLFVFYIPLQPHSSKLVKLEPVCPHGNKLILFWTTYFESDDFYIGGFGSQPFQPCETITCCATKNRSRLDESDAVVFHIRDMNLQDMPKHRPIHQRWIFFLLESPNHTPNILKYLNNVFNWTMTYRIDSDIYAPYPVVTTDELDQKSVIQSGNKTFTDGELKSTVYKKKKLVAWFVSNCKTSSAREKYAAELQNYVEVDVYGSCGPLKCSRSVECYKMLEQDYKFYLAFENSICQDYVTEKFYNALLFKTVPIVYGGANYSAVAPKGSYINVRDFPSVKHLAEYLKFLDRNDNAYMRYFHWRQVSPGLSSLPRIINSWCTLCSMLNNSSLPTSSYPNIHHWWFDKGRCV